MTNKERDQVGVFSTRELRLIANCKSYALNDPAGLAGHNLMMIISKLADILDVAGAVIPEKYMEHITASVVERYITDGEQNPSQSLFEQIKGMSLAKNFVRRDSVRPRRTAEQIAESQGRDMIYICPDGTFRNHAGEIVGKKGGTLHGTRYNECIPFAFGSEEDFQDWINGILDED